MSSIRDYFKDNTKTKLGLSSFVIITGCIIVAALGSSQTRIGWHIILTFLILGFYWSWRKGSSFMGLSIDTKIMGGFTVLYMTMCVLIFKK